MKTCTKCLREKPVSEYFVRDKLTGRLHAQCKTCYAEHRKSYHRKHYEIYKQDYLERAKKRRHLLRKVFRENMYAYMSDKCCLDCGEKDIRVLELDHLDPKVKEFSVSQSVKLGYSWEDTLKEIEKCQVLCANCHKKKTAIQYGWYKSSRFINQQD